MHFVDATAIEQWSERRTAEDTLPQLVRKLIQATARDLVRISFPAGEGVRKPGVDGITENSQADAHVPEGHSIWELGTGRDPRKKANEDYRKRTDEPDEEIVPKESTFIFVTSRRWPDKDKWAQKKKEEDAWKDVRAYDADDLETWLERAPSVHAWFSAELGVEPTELQSLEDWWHSWSNKTSPPLPVSVFRDGREREEESLRQLLEQQQVASILGVSQGEALAFLTATILEGDLLPGGLPIECCLVVHTPQAWRRVAAAESPLLLLPTFGQPNLSLALQNSHRVVIPLGPETPQQKALELPRLRFKILEKHLQEILPERDRASALAALGRRSLLALRRKLAHSPELTTPDWARSEHARDILPALLAGRWSENSEGDREIIARLANRPYEEVIERLMRWVHVSDPPARRIGDVWGIIAREDAWILLHRHLTSDDLKRFEEAAVQVLGADDPRLDLASDQRYMAQVLGVTPEYSGTLTISLAGTLALMAAYAEPHPVLETGHGQELANRIADRLLPDQEHSDPVRRWTSLAPVLPRLAEAAPEVFLRRCGTSLKLESAPLVGLFQDRESSDFFGSSSPHSYLLWALETLAWERRYLPQVVSLLATLTRLDPGGRFANRPKQSLHDLLRLVRPGTAASFHERLGAIDRLRQSEPAVAWELMLELIPSSGVGMFTRAPEWREWKPEDEPAKITYGEVWSMVEALLERLLEDVGLEASRWLDLLDKLRSFSETGRAKLIEQLDCLDHSQFSLADRRTLADGIRKLLAHHRRFPNAQWVLPAEVLGALDQILEKIEPIDAISRRTWLFQGAAEQHFYSDQVSFEEQRINLEAARAEALQEILNENGMPNLLEWVLSEQENRPDARAVGWTLAKISRSDEDTDRVLDLFEQEQEEALDLADAFAAGVSIQQANGTEWATQVLDSKPWTPQVQARFLNGIPATAELWALAAARGEQVEREYWRTFQGTNFRDLEADRDEAVAKLLEHERPHLAVYLLGFRSNKESLGAEQTGTVARALEMAAQTAPAGYFRQFHDLAVETLLDFLADQGYDENKRGQLEWIYLPFFKHTSKGRKTLHNWMATKPEFFVEIVSYAYKPRSGGDQEPDEETQHKARQAYELLSTWQTVPGTGDDGSINRGDLMEWISKTRRLLVDCDRLLIGEQQIGSVLFYAASHEDGVWPSRLVCGVIEELDSEAIDTGFSLELQNSRGVTSRNPTEGGDQERELVTQYREWADALIAEFPRTADILYGAARSYECEARRHDTSAELREDGWD